MENQQLIDFIKHSRQAGKPDSQIRQELLGSGWNQIDVDSALSNQTPKELFSRKSFTISLITVILVVLAGVLFIWFKKVPSAIDVNSILNSSFARFREVNNFYYSEISEENDTVSDGSLGYKGQKKIEGVIVFPSKTNFTEQYKSFRQKDENNKYIEKETDFTETNSTIFYNNNFYNKNFTHYGTNWGAEFQNLTGKFYKYDISDLGDYKNANYSEPIMSGYQWLYADSNLNNPNLIKEKTYLGEKEIDGKKYYNIKIIDYDFDKLIHIWDNSGTKLAGQQLIEGYSVKDFIETYKNPNIYNEGELLIDKDTLLPDSLNFVLVFRYELNEPDSAVYNITITKKILFSRYNDATLSVQEPNVENIIDPERVNQLLQERMKNKNQK